MFNSIAIKENLDAEVLREQVRLAYKQLPTMQISSFVVAVVLSFHIRHDTGITNILLWLSMLSAVSVSRIVLYGRFRRVSEKSFPAEDWSRYFLLLAGISGLVWGASSFIILPLRDLKFMYVFLLVIASLSAATTISHSTVRWAPASWTVPSLLPYALRCLVLEGELAYILSFLVVIYMFSILYLSNKHYNTIASSISLKYDNLKLLDEVKQTNTMLTEDIAERIKTEKLLGRSEALLRESQEIAGVGSWELDLVTNVLTWSDEVYRIFGLRPQEFGATYESFLDHVHPDDRAAVDEAYSGSVREGKDAYEIEHRVVRKSTGEIRYVHEKCRHYGDNAGKIIRSVGTVLDITARKLHEKAVTDSKEEWERTFNSVPDLIALLDREHRIVRSNRAMAELLETTPDDLVGRYCYEVVHGTSAPPDYCPHERLLKTGREESSEFQEHRLGGVFEVRTTPVHDTSGQLVGSVHIMRDITENRRLEDQLRNAQKMEAIGQLARGIAHDFNNIVNVIIGFSSLVNEGLSADSPLRDHMKEVLAAANRAACLTQRLLAFSRRQIVDLRPVNINDIIINLKKMFGRLLGENIEQAVDLADRPLAVMADVVQIEQALINLATNARDAMPDGGRLSISTGIQEIDDSFVTAYGYGKQGVYALITVSDTGAGMDPETQERIFEPFFTTKGIGKGTGLGLSICYGIIKQHKGYIIAHGRPGKGTTFEIYLPLVDEQAGAIEEDVTDAMMSGTETILLAEDEASLRKMAKIVFESFGYTLILAEDGEDAINKFNENRDKIQLVICDMFMPKRSGKEAYEEIKKTSPDIKVLFLSGEMMDDLETDKLGRGDFDFISKPVLMKDLLKKVREVLDR